VRRFLLFVPFLMFVLAAPAPVTGQNLVGVAATVNDDVITLLDVTTRTNLFLLGAGVGRTAELENRLAPHVLRVLIDERLKIQAASANGIEVPESAVNERLDFVASRNNMTIEQFSDTLYRSGILIDTLRNQITGELAWTETIGTRFRNIGQISGTQIDERMRRFESGDQLQYLVAQVLVAADRPGEDAAARIAAEDLLALARQGVPITTIAQQLSQGPAALNDGVLGWLFADILEDEIRTVVPTLEIGEFAGPIRTSYGYVIIQLMDRRDLATMSETTRVRLARMTIPVDPSADADEIAEAQSLGNSLGTQIQGCEEFSAFARQLDPELNQSTAVGVGVISQLPPDVQPFLENAEIGKPTAPHRTAHGFDLYMICEEIKSGSAIPTRDQIYERLRTEALDTAYKEYLSELRRNAVIEIRF